MISLISESEYGSVSLSFNSCFASSNNFDFWSISVSDKTRLYFQGLIVFYVSFHNYFKVLSDSSFLINVIL